MQLLKFAELLGQRLDVVWTFMLLFARFTGLLHSLPGIGGGMRGLLVRVPAIVAFAAAAMVNSPIAPLPDDNAVMALGFLAEFCFGFVLGLVPLMVVTGVQTGAQLASGTMGLGQAQLMDPTTGGTVSDLARIKGDLVVIMFLMLGGHYAVIAAASGISGSFAPGSLSLDGATAELLVNRSGDIFRVGVMISAPVVMALLLAQFVMGMVSKAVPTVNIFIISFPLTIGVGFILTSMALPEMVRFVTREFQGVDTTLQVLIEQFGGV